MRDIALAVITVFLIVQSSILVSQGEVNDIVVLTYHWRVVENLTYEQIPARLIKTKYTPDSFKYEVGNGYLFLEDGYHIALNFLSLSPDTKYWIIVAKIEPVEGFYGKPPRVGIGGFYNYCNTVPCPKQGYWISALNIYPSIIVFQLQGHCSWKHGEWYYSKDVKLEKNRAYTIFFGRIGEYVAGGLWLNESTIFYFRDTVRQPIITVYGSSMKIYWIALLTPSTDGYRLFNYIPASRLNGNIIVNTNERLLLREPYITYITTLTKTVVQTKPIITHITVTLTKKKIEYLTETRTTTLSLIQQLEEKTTCYTDPTCTYYKYLTITATIVAIGLTIILLRQAK